MKTVKFPVRPITITIYWACGVTGCVDTIVEGFVETGRIFELIGVIGCRATGSLFDVTTDHRYSGLTTFGGSVDYRA